jgi:hypothetical protein
MQWEFPALREQKIRKLCCQLQRRHAPLLIAQRPARYRFGNETIGRGTNGITGRGGGSTCN